MKISLLLLALLLNAATAIGAGPNDIAGLWNTEGGDARLRLFKCGERVCGRIVWLKVPRYIDGNDGPVGQTKVDRRNPDPTLRNRPILGLQVVNGLAASGSDRWGNGTCYDPETGRTYRCKMRLTSPDRLEVRGYVGISLIGRTFSLTRERHTHP